MLADRGAQTQKQLTEAVELDKSSMVLVIDKLERQGLVRRERVHTDRRAYAVTLTDHGRAQLLRAAGIATDILGEILDVLTAEEERQLNELLTRIIQRTVR